MRTQSFLVFMLVVTGLAAMTVPVQAQRADRADAALQAALHIELVEGDLERAIRMYQEIGRVHAANRPAAALALVYLGRAYEKLGDTQARAAYERVVREYGDQTEPVRVARERLQTFTASGSTGNGASREPTYTMLMGQLPDQAQFDFSPSGDRVVLREVAPSGETAVTRLVIADQGGAVMRQLVEGDSTSPTLRSPRWSPDGRFVFYYQVRWIPPDSMVIAFMLAPVDGGAPRAFLTRSMLGSDNFSGGQGGGVLWTPDSRAITFGTRQGIETVSLEGHTLRTVPFRARHRTQLTGYSPDGRWIALHEINEGSEQDEEMDVWILPAEGGRAIQLTQSPGFDGWPTWAPGGRAMYFVSGRSGSDNVWRMELEPRSGLPRGEPQQVTFYTDATIRNPRLVDGGRRLAFALQRTTSVLHVAPASSPTESRTVARGRFGTLSPDGRTLYYVSEGTGREGIFSVPAAGGEPRRLTTGRPGGPAYQPFVLAADGRTVAWFHQTGAHNVLFTVPAAGGEPRELLRFESREALVPSWSPDGAQLAYSHGNGLYAVAATGGEPRRVSQLYSWDGWTVRWSPDGSHIAALGWVAPGSETNQNAVFVAPGTGGEARRLTPPEEGGYKEVLEWHPDGRRLSYMYYGDNGAGDGSRLAYLDGRPTELLVDQPAPQWDYVGTWSPDGRQYYFISSARGAWGLFVHDGETGRDGVLVPETVANPGVGVPSFSRDGRIMAYNVTRMTRQLWVMEMIQQ